MGRRTWIDSDIWNDTRSLTTKQRELYLRLLANENGNSAGYYKLNTKHLAVDMGVSMNKLISMLTVKNKYWSYDIETEQVLIPKYTKYNIVRGRPQEVRLNSDLAKLSPCKLHNEFLIAFEECNGIGAADVIDEKFKAKARSIT